MNNEKTVPPPAYIAKSAFAYRLQSAMDSKDMYQKDLSIASGIKASSISAYLNEETETLPSADNIVKLSNTLKCSADYLLGLSDIPSQNATVKSMHNKIGLSEYSIKHLMLWRHFGANGLAVLLDHLLEDCCYNIELLRNHITYRDTILKAESACRTLVYHRYLPEGISEKELANFLIDKELHLIFDDFTFNGKNVTPAPDKLIDTYVLGGLDNLMNEVLGGADNGQHSGAPR